MGLPEGWVEANIGDVAQIVSGGTPKANDESNFSPPGTEIAWLTPADLSGYKRKGISFGRRDLSQKGLKTSSAKLMPKGAVLFSSRAPIGYVVIAENEISTNQGFKSFVFTSDVSPSYAYFYLRSIRSLAESLGTGTTFKELSSTAAKKLPFILPPLNEQIRIANKLDSLLAKVEAAQSRLEKTPVLLKRFRQSVLAAATSGELTQEWREGNADYCLVGDELLLQVEKDRQLIWEAEQIAKFEVTKKCPKNESWKRKYKSAIYPNRSDYVDIPDSWAWFFVENLGANRKYAMSSGPFGSALGTKDYVDSGVPVLRGKNVKNGIAGVGDFVFVTESKASSIPRSLAYPGDIIVVAVGSSGLTGIISDSIDKVLISQNCNKITVNKNIISAKYFNMFLQAGLAQAQIAEKTTDTVRQFFSLTSLKKTAVAVPPPEEQAEIVRRVESLFTQADKVEAQYQAAKTRLDKLTQSILAKAFRGELVPQDPNDEPASELLKRIQAEREEQVKTKPKRARKKSAISS